MFSRCTVSNARAKGADSTATTRHWMQFRRMPSRLPARASMQLICTEKARAQPSSSKSPRLMPAAPMQLSRYSPTTARATLNRAARLGFFLRNRPMMGTSTMYMAVRNPALPASVYRSPSCCKVAAANRAQPQISPTFHSLGFFHFCMDARQSPRSKARVMGSKKALPAGSGYFERQMAPSGPCPRSAR